MAEENENEVEEVIDVNDRIVIPNPETGINTVIFRNKANTEWGRTKYVKVGNRTKQVWTTDDVIPSGTTFWYIRNGQTPVCVYLPAE